MLMKLRPAINFINVKHTNFLYERRFVVTFWLCQKKLYEKFVHKMLMKLRPGVEDNGNGEDDEG